MLEQLKEQWDNILLHVKEEHDIMDVSFNTWLLPLKIFAVDGNVVKILAPDAQMLRYIQKKYGLILQVSIEEVTGFACSPGSGRIPRRGLQPSVYLWRRGTWKNPSDALHRPFYFEKQPGSQDFIRDF